MVRTRAAPGGQPPRSRASAARFAIGGLFIALLVAAVAVPRARTSFVSYPAVSNFWSLLPFAALFVLPAIDPGRPWRRLHLDLLALLAPFAVLGLWTPGRHWSVLVIYPPLLYVALRMGLLARARSQRRAAALPTAPILRLRWLAVGIVVLAAVHISWTVDATATSDVASASARGGSHLVHGQPLYGVDRKLIEALAIDPHFDTYGPVTYEAYAPFAAVASVETAERMPALFFAFVTAFLLFVLGRRARDPLTGLTLAFMWLAFPFTLYTDEISVNDSLVAATLVGTLLVSPHPARRGAMAALAGWTKLTPLALLPLLAGQDLHKQGSKRALSLFATGFLLVSAIVFTPVLVDGSAGSFLGRTIGYQLTRHPAYSIWEFFQEGGTLGGPAIVRTIASIAHGLLAAIAGAFILTLFWIPRRRDLVGLAAATTAVLVVVQLCNGYFSFGYILWFAPCALAALLLDGASLAPTTRPATRSTNTGRRLREGRAQDPRPIAAGSR